ncbi:MAG TPA: hypothetical protein DD670_10580 [Planctomycetaceae bacterium]|nr:hypothetical protein [Planctomycetaceae bacterium]
MIASSSPRRRSAPEDVFIRWVIYSQLAGIGVGVLIRYLPMENSAVLQGLFLAGFAWLLLSSYLYPVVILVWTVACGKRLAQRFLVVLAGAILLYVQTGVVILLH